MPVRRRKSSARRKPRGAGNADGFSLIEVMIAAFLVLLVFTGLGQLHMRSRSLQAMHRTHRQATSLALTVLDDIRANSVFDGLAALDGDSDQVTLGGRDFTVDYDVAVDSPDTDTATVRVDVSWDQVMSGSDITRTVSMETIMARSVEWQE